MVILKLILLEMVVQLHAINKILIFLLYKSVSVTFYKRALAKKKIEI